MKMENLFERSKFNLRYEKILSLNNIELIEDSKVFMIQLHMLILFSLELVTIL